MNDLMPIALVLSWLAIVALTIVVYALSRQIGVLHQRISPVGALSLGQTIEAGSPAPQFTLPSLTGGEVVIGGEAEKVTLLFFLSSNCPVCKTLLPALTAIARQEADWVKVIFASDGDESEHHSLIMEHGLRAYPYLLSTELGMSYQISKLPYAVLIDKNGVIAAHGLANSREHIESLFEALRLDVTDIQHYQATMKTGA